MARFHTLIIRKIKKEKEEEEISLDPNHRNKHIRRKMLTHFLKCCERLYSMIIISCTHHSNDINNVHLLGIAWQAPVTLFFINILYLLKEESTPRTT